MSTGRGKVPGCSCGVGACDGVCVYLEQCVGEQPFLVAVDERYGGPVELEQQRHDRHRDLRVMRHRARERRKQRLVRHLRRRTVLHTRPSA